MFLKYSVGYIIKMTITEVPTQATQRPIPAHFGNSGSATSETYVGLLHTYTYTCTCTVPYQKRNCLHVAVYDIKYSEIVLEV